MGKVRVYDISLRERYDLVGELLEVISNLRSKRDTVDCIIGLLTASESLMIARRVRIARLLIEQKSYVDIRAELHVSTNTIANTERWLRRGHAKRQKILERHILKAKGSVKQYSGKSGEKSPLDKYPQHRFLKDLLEEVVG